MADLDDALGALFCLENLVNGVTYLSDGVLSKLKKETVLRDEGRLSCEACGFDFERRYGELGLGFIECHHRFPLGEGEERETTLDDLALLCANCHRMIHRSKLTQSVEELQRALRDADGEA